MPAIGSPCDTVSPSSVRPRVSGPGLLAPVISADMCAGPFLGCCEHASSAAFALLLADSASEAAATRGGGQVPTTIPGVSESEPRSPLRNCKSP